MHTLLMQTCCRPRAAYQIADKISIKNTHTELKPVAGDFDLSLKPNLPKGEDIGKFLNESLPNTETIERTHTWHTYEIFAQ